LGGPIVVIWDRLAAHRSKRLRKWLRRGRRVHLEYLPGYAPELNPNEYGWAYLKGHRLANYCPLDVEHLHTRVIQTADQVAGQQSLLQSFIKATELPIRLKL
jgi:transposase